MRILNSILGYKDMHLLVDMIIWEGDSEWFWNRKEIMVTTKKKRGINFRNVVMMVIEMHWVWGLGRMRMTIMMLGIKDNFDDSDKVSINALCLICWSLYSSSLAKLGFGAKATWTASWHWKVKKKVLQNPKLSMMMTKIYVRTWNSFAGTTLSFGRNLNQFQIIGCSKKPNLLINSTDETENV